MKIKNSLDTLDIPKITGIVFLILSLISCSLWFSYEPELPRCPWFGEATYSADYCLIDFIVSIGTFTILLLGLWLNEPKRILLGLALLIILCLFDLNRLNAITYFFFCLWILWILTRGDKTLYKHVLIVLLTGVYFWSGFHKWNIHFFSGTYYWLMDLSPLTRGLIENKAFSYILPALESVPALMLLFPRSRKYGIVLLVLMHLYIIYFMTLIEWGRGIIVWNILMMILLLYCWNFQDSLKNFFKKENQYPLILLLFNSFVFPCLFCFDMITSELAYTMYCGRLMETNMVFTKTDTMKLDKKYHPYLIPYKEFFVLDIDILGFKTYESEFCRTAFTTKKMFQKLNEPFSDTCMLVIARKSILREPEYEYVYKE